MTPLDRRMKRRKRYIGWAVQERTNEQSPLDELKMMIDDDDEQTHSGIHCKSTLIGERILETTGLEEGKDTDTGNEMNIFVSYN